MKLKHFFYAGFCCLMLSACGGNKTENTGAETLQVDETTFYASQPVESGLYDAETYDITGTNAKKGHFDGRVYFSLSPELNAIQVFENGNRTKIDCKVVFEKPFERNDTGVFVATDIKGNLITVNTDSTLYLLKFKHSGDDYAIGFNPKPRHTGSAIEILEKINGKKR